MKEELKWIRLKVGFYNGLSFKKMKRAKVDGIADLRDKLEAMWWELVSLAGASNDHGILPYGNPEDLALELDRGNEETSICLEWFIKNGMVEKAGESYAIKNWGVYQDTAKIEMQREATRLRVAQYRERKKAEEEPDEEPKTLSQAKQKQLDRLAEIAQTRWVEENLDDDEPF